VASCYPIDGEVVCTDRVARWRPLVNWILIAPLALWLAVLQFGAIVVTFLGWFAILFNEQLPQRYGDYLVAVLRYEWRVSSYLLGLTDRYPGWRVVGGYVDPGNYPALLYSARPPRRNRGTVLFRGWLVIPQRIVLAAISVVGLVVLIFAWFAVLVLGRWPRRVQRFVIGWMRWTVRVNGYRYLIVDAYPPFRFAS
jgi:uncharacterized protein DUF4389